MPRATDLDASLEDGRRVGLLSYLAENPHTTVAEILASEAAGEVLKTLTFAELSTAFGESTTGARRGAKRSSSSNGAAQPRGANPVKRRGQKAKGKPKASSDGGLNLRTAAAREEYQSAMLNFLQEVGDKVSAVEIRQKVGGSEPQVRTALKALEHNGDVDHAGKTAATRYWAT